MKKAKTDSKEKKSRRSLIDDYKTPEMLIYLEDLKRQGMTDEEIAGKIGITARNFAYWKAKCKEIRDAVKNGKFVSNAQVVNALFKAALGHVVKVPTILKDKQSGIPLVRKADGEIGIMTGEKGEEAIVYDDYLYIKPDVKAMIYYLANRCYEDWRMNRTEESGAEKASPGVVEVVVRNGGLEELERKAIEEAKKKDAEAEKKAG